MMLNNYLIISNKLYRFEINFFLQTIKCVEHIDNNYACFRTMLLFLQIYAQRF